MTKSQLSSVKKAELITRTFNAESALKDLFITTNALPVTTIISFILNIKQIIQLIKDILNIIKEFNEAKENNTEYKPLQY